MLPQVTSTFSHGMPSISADTRWQSLTDSVPRLPMPDWMYSRPSGLMTNRPSNPIEPATNVLTATPTPRTFDAVALAALRLALVPLEQLGALVERLLDERARHVLPRRLRTGRRAELRLALRRVDAADRHLIDAELARRLGDDRLHQHDALHAARLTLRTARRRVGQHRDAAPPHRRRLIQQRRDRRRCCCSRPGARTDRCR